MLVSPSNDHGKVCMRATSTNHDQTARAVAGTIRGRHRDNQLLVFARAHAVAPSKMTLRLRVRPNAKGRQLVKDHRYSVTLRLWVTYTPTHGLPRSIGY